jgi:Na+/melibiose symporter-like transporter
MEAVYRRAKTWQIGLFSLNNAAVNLYYMMMLYIAYFASGVLGLGVALVAGLIMSMNVLDGIIDPVVGWFIDRTNGRFGKFRPFMILGNVVMAFSLLLMCLCQYAGTAKVPLFIFAYVVHIFGYTFQFCITRAAQSALTNDPKQRPVFSAFDMVMNVILYVGVSMAVSNYLVVKHGDFTGALFGEFFVITALASAVCTLLAVVGIWQKDRIKFFGLAEKAPKVKLSDAWNVLRRNRSVQMLMLSAGTDKLFSNMTTNAVVTVIIYGIICGDYALSGQLNMFVFLPSIVVSLLCIQYARKLGQKEAFLFGTYGGMIFTVLIFLLFVFGNPTSLSFTSWGLFTVLFLLFMALRGGFMSVNNSIIVPMIADCADYEVARSGKYLPGTIGALFSCVDKLVTSLNSVIVGALVILAGYRASYPTVNTPYSTELFWVGMICFCALPMLGWIVNIICMRFYPLSKAKMAEVQQEIRDVKESAS